MGVGEAHGFRHRIAEGKGFRDRGRRVVGMAGPVDHAAFDHQKKTVRIVEQLDAPGGQGGEGRNSVPPVDRIRQAGRPVRFGRYDDGLAGPALQRVERIDGADDGIAVLFGQAVGVRPVLLFPGGPEQSAAGEVVDSAPAHLHGDVVVVRAGRHVRVEGRPASRGRDSRW